MAQISRALRLLQSGDFLVKKHHWCFSDFNPYVHDFDKDPEEQVFFLLFRGRLEEKLFPINHRFCDLKWKSMNFCETTDNKNVWKKYGLTRNAFILP